MSGETASSAWRDELRQTLHLAWPLALGNLLQMLVYSIDVIFVARLGEQALAASSLSIAIFALTMWSFSFLTAACAPLIAAELGRRRHAVRQVRHSVRMALWLAVLCGLIGMAVASYGREILLATGQDPEVARLAETFLDVLRWSMIPLIICNVLRNFVSALGRPIYGTVITAVSILVNIVGNYAFVFGHFGSPAFGLPGSAAATIVTAIFTMAAFVLAIQADRRLRRYHIFGRLWRADWKRMGDILRIGVPVALTVLAEAGLFSAAAFLMGWIGEAQLAGHTVALQLASLAFQVPFGIGQAATIRVGYHYGARDPAGVARAGKAALLLAMGFMAVPAALMLFTPHLILTLYVDPYEPKNAAMVGYAVSYLAVAAAFQFFDGAQVVMAGALRGLQDTRVPLAIALFGYWVIGLATALVLGFRTSLAGTGVWIGLAAGLVVVSLLLGWRWSARERLRLVPH